VIFNLATYFGDAEQNISFPTWFNDSIVKSRKIVQISRSIFGQDESFNNGELIQIPSRKYNYSFNRNGNLTGFSLVNYYDNRKLNEIAIYFSNHDSKTGFSDARIESKDTVSVNEFRFQKMMKVKQTKNVLIFKDQLTSSRLFIIHNNDFWKPLAVDSICKPDAKDRIIWGAYSSPTKKYFVQNMVEESDVRNYSYKKGVLKNIEWKDDPFEIRRTFNYSKEGYCRSFIDSTFGMGTFISATKYQFKLKDGLPISMKQSAFHEGKEIVLFRESYEYLYR